jgi:hypothetical protein
VVVRGPAPGGEYPAGSARPHGTDRLTSNSAYAQVQNEHVWRAAWAEIMKNEVTPQVAAEKAFKRVEEIFAKYPIAEG